MPNKNKDKLVNLPIHYVYKHINPKTNELLYIGHGRGERAWRYSNNGDWSRYGHRSPEHAAYLFQLQLEGYIATDWTVVLHKCLSKTQACEIEQQLIRDLKPELNKPVGKGLLKLTGDSLKEAIKLRNSGVSYELIAKTLDISTMTVWRTLNKKNKNVST